MPLSIVSGNKINFTSLGCPRNLVDTEVMLGLLLRAGYEATESPEEADYLVVNTCGFLESARQESEETIEELQRRKKKDAKLIITGCMVSKHKERVAARFPDAHALLGSGDVERIIEAVQAQANVELVSAKSYLEAGEVPRTLSTPPHYAYLKIAEGCLKRCAYCQIPDIKGPLKSKPIEQIVRELILLLKQGVKEIILIAQDLGDYGKDGMNKEGKLANLLRELLKIKGDYWLRLLYLYPDEITKELLALMQSDLRICRYLDMPIQHINDGILRKMRRKTNGKAIKKTITDLRSRMPDLFIRTSLIVGFPGETEEQFQELLDFVQEFPLNHAGIFTYSREEGTAAALMEDQVPEEVKLERKYRLASVQKEMALRLNQHLIGRKLEVVVEGYHPDTRLLMQGRFYGQCPEIDSVVILNDARAVRQFGQRYWVEITGCAGYDLVGRALKPVKSSIPIQITY